MADDRVVTTTSPTAELPIPPPQSGDVRLGPRSQPGRPTGQRAIRCGTQRLAKAMGWFSLGLGLAEVVMPRRICTLLGIGDRRMLIRALGAREIATGVGILAQQRPAGWLWARVGGDAIDLALLGAALASPRAARARIAAAIAAVAGVTAVDAFAAQELSRADQGAAVTTGSIVIQRSPEELYRFWRDPSNLRRFMKHVESVQATGDGRLRWIARGPGGTAVQWETLVVADRPGERIAWRSLEGSEVDMAGTVRFERAAGDRGTIVRLELQYRPPGGRLGATIARLLGRSPQQQIAEDLRRCKCLIETGEIITTEGQPAGRFGSTSWKYDQAIRG